MKLSVVILDLALFICQSPVNLIGLSGVTLICFTIPLALKLIM